MTTRPVSRRHFLAGLAATTGLGATGCGVFSASADDAVDLGLADSVRVLNWPDYIDEAMIAGDDRIAGLTVEYAANWEDNYSGWELIEPSLLNGGATGYDVVVPTNWRAAQMIEKGWAEQIPLEAVPNHPNIEPAYLTNSWDRGARFHMPWQAGITGIAYNPERTGREITSINDLFDPAFAGRVGMIGEMREAVGLAMLAAGDDPARATRTTAESALERIEQANTAGQFRAWLYNDFATELDNENLWITMAWSGDAIALRDDLKFVIPDEGAIRWFDTMVIPVGSSRIAGAARFMNEFYEPERAARLTAFTGYTSPVIGAREAMIAAGGASAELAANPAIFPDAETERRLFSWDGLDSATDNELDDRFAGLLP